MRITGTPFRVNGSFNNRPIVWVEDANGKRVCTVRSCEEDSSRANLLAAAPDLLRACFNAVARFDDYANAGDSVQDEIKVLEAAIAKAEGREN